MVDWGAIVEQTPSIALSLLFAWFALTLINTSQAFQSRMMDDWRAHLDKISSNLQQSLRELTERQDKRMAEHDERTKEIIEIVLKKYGRHQSD